MAQFNIKRGDSMPPLMIGLRVAGSDPETFWDFGEDDVGAVNEDNGESVGVHSIKFTMTNIETGEIVGLPANVSSRFTGYGELYTKTVGYLDPPANTQPIRKSVLRYNWQQPSVNFNPAAPSSSEYRGDTGVAGLYKGEFEVIYNTSDSGYQRRKRSFPSTPGDMLVINVLPDDNDKLPTESV